MKKIFIALLFILPFKEVFAQKDMLSFNEQNKYIYYQLADETGLSADTLQSRALYFLKMAYPQDKIIPGSPNTSITGKGKFMVTSGVIVKRIDGEISYTFQIECKDQKYRYWLTDFVFTPYKIDRYGNSVPELGIGIPLETGLSRLEKGELEKCLDQAGSYSVLFGNTLKNYMMRSSVLPKDEKKKVIDTKNW